MDSGHNGASHSRWSSRCRLVVATLRVRRLQMVDDKPAARGPPRVRRTVVTRVHEAVKALALCHNVTPVHEDAVEQGDTDSDIEADQQSQQTVCSYSACCKFGMSSKLDLQNISINTIVIEFNGVLDIKLISVSMCNLC